MNPAANLTTVAGLNIGFQDQVDTLKAGVKATLAGSFNLGPAYKVNGTGIDTNVSIPTWSDTFSLGVNGASVDGLLA